MVQGRRRDIGLGGAANVDLAEACEEARRLRKIAKAGGDPIAERQAKDGVPSLEAAARDANEKLKPGWRKGGVHIRHRIASLERHVFPTLGGRPIDTTTSGDRLTVLTPIWHENPETARRERQRLRHVMQWAKGAGHYRGENPVDIASARPPRPARARSVVSGRARSTSRMPYGRFPERG